MSAKEIESKLIIYRGWPEKGEYTWSPFVTKLEFRCRVAGLPYDTDSGSLRDAPKGKIPYVDLSPLQDYGSGSSSEGPNYLGDSTFIIKELSRLGRVPDLNGHLTAEEKLNDLAVRALLEDKLYFCHTRERWMDNFYVQRDKALWSIPYPLRILVGYLIYRNMKTTLHGHGVGRLTSGEVLAMKTEIWQHLDDVLKRRLRPRPAGDGDAAPVSVDVDEDEPVWCFGGERPTEADATLFGFIVSVLISDRIFFAEQINGNDDSAPESKTLVKTFPNVIDYAERIHNRYFPDYKKWK